MAWLNTDSVTHHYFTMFAKANTRTTSTYRLPKETGFEYVQAEQTEVHTDRWYILMQDDVNKV